MEFQHVNTVEVKFPFTDPNTGEDTFKYTEIGNVEALDEWMEKIVPADIRYLSQLFLATDPQYRDHVIPRRGPGIWARMNIDLMMGRERHPVIALDNAIRSYCMDVTTHVLAGRNVLINSKGGFTFLDDKTKVVSRLPYDDAINRRPEIIKQEGGNGCQSGK